MPKRKKAPELTFQQHIGDYLVREHKYGVLEQSDNTDTGHFITGDRDFICRAKPDGDYA